MSVDGELEEDVGEAAVSDEVEERIENLNQEKALTKNINDERRMSLNTFNNVQ